MLKGYVFGPVTPECLFDEPGYYVWCGSVFAWKGSWYMVYSRWKRELGFEAWVTASELCLAKGESLFGRFRPVKVIKTRGTCSGWDRDTGHNPAVLAAEGKLWLWYSGTRGNGEYWDHRNRQRVGAAWAEDPEGEWHFAPEPAADVSPRGFDSLMTSNPAVCVCPDGRYLMLYKAVEDNGERPRGGGVICGSAFAERPAGPFVKTGVPAFRNPNDPWSVEDPFVWHDGTCFRAICSDFHGWFTGTGSRSLAFFRSGDGVHWEADGERPLFSRTEYPVPGGVKKVWRLERPQLVFDERGRPVCFSCACAEDRDCGTVYHVRVPVLPERT